ncbi:MAG: AEC family transporter [Clostridiales Family XIII bacterium]|jgi:predicted permease|nr:AEC family transporter [Clostridiales Family XIII bacterium]
MWSGLESICVIFLIIVIGFFFTYKKIWPDTTQSGLSVIVIRIAAPCLAVTSITAGFNREMLASSLILLLIAVLHLAANFLLGKLTSRMLHLDAGKKTIYEVTYTFSNIIFIGLPINQIVFGEEGVPFLFAYYIVILAAFWSFGVAQIAAAGTAEAAPGDAKIRGKLSFSPSKIFNPGFIGVLIGAGLVQAGLHLPSVLDIALGYLGGLTVPLSLLVIGANLTIFAGSIPRITADEWWIMIGKFVVSPLVMICLLKLFGIEGMPFYVFLLSATMPCHMQTSILAQHYHVESAYASKLVGLSTLISIVTIPAWIGIIHAMM